MKQAGAKRGNSHPRKEQVYGAGEGHVKTGMS